MLACSFRLIWLAENIIDWFFLEKNTVGWLTDLTDNLKQTMRRHGMHWASMKFYG
jgi:hypothetical protein